jgi:hypothetical protein
MVQFQRKPNFTLNFAVYGSVSKEPQSTLQLCYQCTSDWPNSGLVMEESNLYEAI